MEKENTTAAPAGEVEQTELAMPPGAPAHDGDAPPAHDSNAPAPDKDAAARRAAEVEFWANLDKEMAENAKGQPDAEKQAAHDSAEQPPDPGNQEKPETEAPAPTDGPKKQRGRPPKPGKADKPAPAADGQSEPDKLAPEAEGQPAPAATEPKRRGRPPKPDKADIAAPATEEQPARDGEPAPAPAEPKRRGRPPKTERADADATAAPPPPAEPEPPPPPREAPRRGGTEQIVYLNLSELHPFKNHPFGVRDDSEMKALVESVKENGVNQPALVRPREDGGYEIVAGHRRQKASELAGLLDIPCIVREMTDDEAILAMTDDNLRQRSVILPSEKAISLKMQVDAISHQGARTSGQVGQNNEDAGKRSVDIVAQRNDTSAKQVQRYIKLTELIPDLLAAVDAGKIGFTPAVELSFIKPENQNYIAVAMEAEQSIPSLSQAKRMHDMDKKNELNGDVIDGILSEQKKEEIRVIISGKELEPYFSKDKTPQEMKEQIMKLLDDWAVKEKGRAVPDKKLPER